MDGRGLREPLVPVPPGRLGQREVEVPQDAGLRVTFIGTDNYQFGAKLAELTKQLKPQGGTVCIQSGAPASLNLDDRIRGIRDTLAGASKAEPVKRLRR